MGKNCKGKSNGGEWVTHLRPLGGCGAGEKERRAAGMIIMKPEALSGTIE